MTVAEVTHDFEAIKDEVTAAHLRFLSEAQEKPVREASLQREAAYVFRTRAGTIENLRITLPTITHKDESDEKLGPKISKVYARKYGQQGIDYYEDLKDRINGRAIKFTRTGIGKGCHYQTSDPVVAEFLRNEILTGKYNGLYEDYTTSSPIRSRFTDQTFPNTEAGRIELAKYDQAIEKAAAQQAGSRDAVVMAPVATANGKAKVK